MDGVVDIRADRTLLFPGPVAPASHLGATLLRHAVHASLRYALYQLGQPAPEAPATRFVALRLYFDGPKLADALGGSGDAGEVLGALLEPGGAAGGPLSRRLRGALWFHRRRLSLRAPEPRKVVRELAGLGFPEALSRAVPRLGDALLGELLAALSRRQERRRAGRGGRIEPVQSREAALFLAGRTANLACLGPPDPREPSWSETPPAADAAPTELARNVAGRRGGFRELYRACLDCFRSPLLELAASAERQGVLESKDDLFFIPTDLLGDVEAAVDGSLEPTWLAQTIADNRAEWEELAARSAPADTLGNVPVAPRVEIANKWACLAPLP